MLQETLHLILKLLQLWIQHHLSILVPDDITVEATSLTDNIVDIGIAIADDLVDVSSLTNDAPQVFPYGDTIVTWTATEFLW